jgi:6,7-dimethyl-8-ribityllumazine synthase
MTSSDETALPEGAVELLRGGVGRVLAGDHHGRGARVGIACARFNGGITWRLLQGALAGLDACEVDRADTTVAWVPGAFELPVAARALALDAGLDAVVCLGAVGLQRVQLDTGVPVVFGVLTTDTVAQALERSAPGEANKGHEAAVTAVEMHRLLRSAMI